MVTSAKCVVPYCGHSQRKVKDCIYSTFPKNIEQCRLWVKAVGVEDLVHVPTFKLNTLRHVCGCHFTDDQFSNASRQRLKRTAIPSLLDNGIVSLSESMMSQFAMEHNNLVPQIHILTEPHLEKVAGGPCKTLVTSDHRPMQIASFEVATKAVPVTDVQATVAESEIVPMTSVNSIETTTVDIENEEPACEKLQELGMEKRYRPSGNSKNALNRIMPERAERLRFVGCEQQSKKICLDVDVQKLYTDNSKVYHESYRPCSSRNYNGHTAKSYASPSKPLQSKSDMEYNDFGNFVSRSLKLMTSGMANSAVSQISGIISQCSMKDHNRKLPPSKRAHM